MSSRSDKFELRATLELRGKDGGVQLHRAPNVEWTEPQIISRFDGDKGEFVDELTPRQRIDPEWPTITRGDLHDGGQTDENIADLVAGKTLHPVK
jgi:hypothetical protein